MAFIEGLDRNQLVLFPTTLDDCIDENSAVRAIDHIVNVLNLKELGFKRTAPSHTGRPSYDPATLLKLYVYGYMNKVRSSRSLEKEARLNIELKWLINGLVPDHKTIADFRKDNAEAITKACTVVTILWKEAGLIGGELCTLDGTKIKANNNPRNLISLGRLRRTECQARKLAEEFLQLLSEADMADDDEARLPQVKLEYLESKMGKLHKDKRLFKKFLKHLGLEETIEQDEEQGTPDDGKEVESSERSPGERIRKNLETLAEIQQLGETLKEELESREDHLVMGNDPDAIVVKPSLSSSMAGYNLQAVVDSKHHIIVASEVGRNANDQDQLTPMGLKAKEIIGKKFNLLADKGYDKRDDIIKCSKAGISPVVPKQNNSRNTAKGLFRKSDFNYDSERDVFICPANQELHPLKERYPKEYKSYGKKDCHLCPLQSRCTTNKVGRSIKRYEEEEIAEAAAKKAKEMSSSKIRAKLAEHPFGFLKHTMDYRYFIVCGLEKVECEAQMAIFAYNLKRAISVLGVEELKNRVTEVIERLSKDNSKRMFMLIRHLIAVVWLHTQLISTYFIKSKGYPQSQAIAA